MTSAAATSAYLSEAAALSSHNHHEYNQAAHYDDDDFVSTTVAPPKSTTTTIDLIGEEFIKKEDSAVDGALGRTTSSPSTALPSPSSVSFQQQHPSVIQTLARQQQQQQTLASMLASSLSYSASSSLSSSSTVLTNSLPSLTYTTTTIPSISSGDEAGGVLYYNLDELSRYMPENFNFDLGESLGTDGGITATMEGGGADHLLVSSHHHHKGMTMISVPNSTQSFQIQVNRTKHHLSTQLNRTVIIISVKQNSNYYLS